VLQLGRILLGQLQKSSAGFGHRKTNEQVAREVQVLWRVEQERADRRRQAALKQNASVVTAPSPRAEDQGKTRAKVASKVGVGIVRAQQLNTVANTIDTLKQAGKEDEAYGLLVAVPAARSSRLGNCCPR
jgi:hypothetical protein